MACTSCNCVCSSVEKYQSLVVVVAELEVRLKELEDSDYDDRVTDLEEIAIDPRLIRLEEIANRITEDDMKSTKQPYKCPVCDGKGSFKKEIKTELLSFEACCACQCKGIVWG